MIGEELFAPSDPDGSVLLEPGLRLCAFQVPLQNRQSLWFAPQDGLTILYGKNGTGKSTVIRALSALLCKDRHGVSGLPAKDHISARQFFQLDIDPQAFQIFSELLDGYHGHRRQKLSVPRHLRVHGIHKWVKEGIPNEDTDRFQRSEYDQVTGSRTPDQTFSQWIAEELGGSDHFDDELVDLLAEAGQRLLDKHGPRPWPWTRMLFESIRNKLADDFMTGSWVGVTLDDVNVQLKKYGFDTIVTDEGVLTPTCFEDLDFGALLRLYCFQILHRLDQAMDEIIDADTVDLFCSDAVEIGQISLDDHPLRELIDEPTRLSELLATALKQAIKKPSFWLERLGDEEYCVGLAIPTPVAGAITGSDEAQHLFDFLIYIATAPEPANHSLAVAPWRILLSLEQDIIGESFGLDDRHINESRMNFGGCYPDTRFLALEPGAVRPLAVVNSLPFRAFDLSTEYSPDEVAVQSLVSSLRSGEGLNELSGWDEEAPVGGASVELAELTKRFADVAELVRQFDIGVRDIHVSVSDSLRDWADGRAVRIRFDVIGTHDDDGNARPIAFEKLSGAQRYWVSAAMQIVAARDHRMVTLFLADEPEAGLHERAAHRVFSRLATESQNFFIASHSVSALRQRAASLLHLVHGTGERIYATAVGIGDDVRLAAERLGTSSFDLLAMKRTLVVVEGAHDEVVVQRLLRMSHQSALADHVLVIPARGVKNVAHVADSAIITDFTEMEILAVVDNGRAELFEHVMSTINHLTQAGKTAAEILREAGLHKLHATATPEERFMIDLIVRATERGLAHRVHIFALPTPDIIDLLPIESFGLSQSWEALREEFAKEKPVENFKNWLRKKHKTKISVSAVESSFDDLDSLPDPLVRLLREIEIMCSLTSTT